MKHSHDIRQRISTGLQTQGDYIGRQTRVTRETQLEPLKQWLSNKMGGDRQSTWEHMAPTNNKPCAQHTETSGGQPGHTSRTVTVTSTALSVHSKKRWVVFSTQMLGWDRWVRALGCFNPIWGWKLVLIITGNADVKESTHVTSTSNGTPTTPVREAAIFSV